MTTSLAVLRTGAAIVASLLTLAACAPEPNHFSSSGSLAQDRADPSLAVTHQFTLRVPGAEAETLQQKHIAECSKLGCAILSTSIDRSNEGRVSARTSLRIRPDAYDGFATQLAAPPARITMHMQSAEDLAMPSLDAEKRLGAKTLLRDRLTAMLRDSS